MAWGADGHSGERIFGVTDMGWIMGPWLVFGSLLLGASFVIYDGTVDFPGPDRLWKLVDRHKVQVLGISPSLVRALIAYGDTPAAGHDLSSLRILASTGEPWNPEPWTWLFEQIGKSRLPIINYSGGTELSGGILMGIPLLPIKATGIPAPCPGMAADVFDENGSPVRGQVGELVIKAPWIGMTRGFWRDPERYVETFWSRWPGVWVHGDWAMHDQDGQWYVLGRSDDTIKIAGKRLGPAEIESVAVDHPDVVEAAAIAVPDPVKGSSLPVFCVLCPETKPSGELNLEIKDLVARMMGKALAPQEVIFVRDLPKTRNAKVMRRMIRASYLGQDPGDISALINPETLKEIEALRQPSVNFKVTGQ
jgi:acetyl-CoA synthetase